MVVSPHYVNMLNYVSEIYMMVDDVRKSWQDWVSVKVLNNVMSFKV